MGSLPARADVLLDLINAPAVTNAPYSFTFTATSTTTDISIGGYQVPSGEDVENIALDLNGSGTNLLGSSWTFTPAASGSFSGIYSDGTAVPAIFFAGVSTGYYDTYAQTISTTIGDSYTLSFSFTNGLDNDRAVCL